MLRREIWPFGFSGVRRRRRLCVGTEIVKQVPNKWPVVNLGGPKSISTTIFARNGEILLFIRQLDVTKGGFCFYFYGISLVA